MRTWVWGLVAMCLVGCAKHGASDYAAGAMSPASGALGGEYLAYEHDVSIVLPADQVVARMAASQTSCVKAVHGECHVLEIRQRGGDSPGGSLTVRLKPEGVEPFIAEAGAGGMIAARSTRAEDLAQSVHDNALQQSRLGNERERLKEFQQRKDLSVADMIALSQQMAQVEAQLQVAEQEGAQHRHRINTQRLTLDFESPDKEEGGIGEIRLALHDFVSILALGVAWTLRTVAFLIPAVAGLVIVVAVWRRLRRRHREVQP